MNKIKHLLFIPILFSGFSNAQVIGSWTLDGNLSDSSGYFRHGESFNAIDNNDSESMEATFTEDAIGDNQYSYQFYNNNYIALDMRLTHYSELDAFSVTAYFKTTEDDNLSEWSNWSLLDFDRSEYFNLFITGDGRVGFSTLSKNQDDGVKTLNDMYSTTSDLNDGEWHSVTVSYGIKNGKAIYIDGQFDSSISYLGQIGSGITRYGYIGDGSESNAYNSLRNGIYYSGNISNVTLRDNEVSINIDGNLQNLSAFDVPAPIFLSAIPLLFLFSLRLKKHALNEQRQ